MHTLSAEHSGLSSHRLTDAGKALLALKTLGRDPAASRVISKQEVCMSGPQLTAASLTFQFVEPQDLAQCYKGATGFRRRCRR